MATLLDKLKSFLLKQKVKKLIGKKTRSLKLKELADVKTVGVVFDASTEDKYKSSAHLVRHFSSLKKKVNSIAITNTDILPAYVDTTLSFDYILNKEIKWFYYPDNKYVVDFVNNEFDLLVNLDFSDNPTLSFISNTSLAHLKVGIRNDNLDLDFMLEGIKDNDLKVFLKELLKYLELIKTK